MPVTISAGQVDALIANQSSIAGYPFTSKSIIIQGDISYSQASALNAIDAQSITATITPTSAANLASIAVNNSSRTSLNAFTFTVNDTTASAAALNSVKAITSVAPNFSSVNSITASSSSDITSLYSGSTVGLGSEFISVNDTTIDAGTLKAINALTDKVVTSTAGTISGKVADIANVFAAHTNQNGVEIEIAADIAVTVTDTTVDAAALVLLDDAPAQNDQTKTYTTGTITVNSTNVKGEKADIVNLMSSPYGVKVDDNNPARFNGVLGLNVILDNTAGTLKVDASDVRDIIDLAGYTGKVTATLNATEKTIAILLDSTTGLKGTGHSITIPAIETASISAADLVTLDAATDVKLTFNNGGGGAPFSPALTGTAADVVAVLSSTGIDQTTTAGLGASAINVNSGNTSIAQANLINTKTTGDLTATITERTMSELAGIATKATGDNNLSVTVNDLELDAAALNALDAKTATAINIAAAQKITGSAADLAKIYDANKNNFAGEGAEAVVVTGTSVAAADITSINNGNAGSKTINSTVSTITGTAAAIKTALTNANAAVGQVGVGTKFDAAAATVLGAVNATVTGTTATAEDLNAIRGFSQNGTTGVITASGLTSGTITLSSDFETISGGTAAVISSLISSEPPTINSITSPVLINGLQGKKVSLTVDVNSTLAALNTITDTYNVGEITAKLPAGLIATFLPTASVDGIKKAGNKISVDVTDKTAIAAADLIALDAITTGTIDLVHNHGGVGANPSLAGSAADLATVIASASITGTGDAVIDVTDTGAVSLAHLKALDDGSTGKVTADNFTSAFGSIADAKHIYQTAATGAFVGEGNEDVIINDLIVDAALLDDFTTGNGNTNAPFTDGQITVTSSAISGDLAVVQKMLNNSALNTTVGGTTNAKFTGLAAVDVIIPLRNAANNADQLLTVQNVEDLAAKTTGTITATLNSNQVINLGNLTEVHNLSIAITGAQVNASTINDLTTKATGSVTTVATSIVGDATSVLAVFANNKVTGIDGDEAISLTGAPTVAQVNDVASKTTGAITATIVSDVASLKTLSEAGNYTISVTDSVISAADLALAAAKTTGTITIGGTSTISGSYAEVTAITGTTNGNQNPFNITGIGTAKVNLTDSSNTVAQVKTIIDINNTANGTVTAKITEQDAQTLLNIPSGPHDLDITVAVTQNQKFNNQGVETQALDTKVNATQLDDIDALTTKVLKVTSTVLTDTYANADEIIKVLEASNSKAQNGTANTPTISGLESANVEFSNTGTITLAQAQKLTNANSGTTGVVTASVASRTIAQLASTANAGTATEAITLQIEAGNKLDLIISDTTFDSEHLKEVLALDAATTGTITLSGDNAGTGDPKLTGTIAQLKSAYESFNVATGAVKGIDNIGSSVLEAVIATDEVISAADLKYLNGLTDQTITFNGLGADNIISGTYADLVNVFTSGVHTDIEGATIAVTVTDTITAAEQVTLDGLTAGVITATISDTSYTGKLANIANRAQVDHNLTITLDDASVAAASVLTLVDKTAGLITVNTSKLTGSSADVTTVLGHNNGTGVVTGLSSTPITLNPGGNTALADANTINGLTSGPITATITETALTDLAGLQGTGNNYTITVATPASVSASDLNALNAKTTGVITVGSTTITGFLSDIKAAYDANTAGELTGLGTETVSITDTGTVLASDLSDVNLLTAGAINAASATAVKGSLSDLIKVYTNSAGIIAGLGTEAVTVTDTGSVSAADLTKLDGLTSGAITASSVTSLTGSTSEIKTAYTGTLSGTGLTSLDIAGATDTFDAVSYLASHGDLISAFGNSVDKAISHYLTFGVNESRSTDSFDEKSYLASHADLLAAFGSDTTKATAHYISNGYSENRSVDSFDELGYVASYKDLITALGDNAAAAVDHYINFGYGESRTATFNASSYLAANADLQAAFGSDEELAKKHYINHGVNENRLLA